MVIMEFETSNKGQQPGEITDEVRLAASSKRVTLSPLHTEVVPDEPADELTASHHVQEPPIGNIAIDQESTNPASLANTQPSTDTVAAQPAPAQKSKALPPFITLGASLLVVGVVAAIMLFTK